NLPVTADQLGSVLAPSTVDGIAAESGQSKPAVLEALTGLLPKIVDQATEGGNVPASGGFDASALLGMLTKLG
ncbi:MAG TPA: YidB family protein, partial [Oxalicibacterium sp.]|nr:YidB family protein [Oxalicibacterium sp.]